MKWTWLLGMAGACAVATAAAQSIEPPQPDPGAFDTPITWFDAVDAASTSQAGKTLGTMFRGANAVMTFGFQSQAVRSLPPRFSAIARDEIAFKVYVSPRWDLPPYGEPAGRVSRQRSRVDLALARWCQAHGGQTYEPETGSWTCERDGQFLAVADWGHRHPISAPFLTVMQPLDASTASTGRFSDLVQSAGFALKRDVDRRLAAESAQQARQSQAWDARQQAQAPLRRKIGTKVCQDEVRYGTKYIGFVEGRSPDLDKIQIRIVAHIFQGPAQSLVGGFHEQIVWSDPDRWYLCE